MPIARKNSFQWFTGLDIRSIGLFRIVLALCVLLDLVLYRFPYVQELYSESGIMPVTLLRQVNSIYQWGLLSFPIPEWLTFSVLLVLLLAGLALLTGWHARAAAVVLFLGMWSLQQRNPLAISGYDEILISMLFWAMWLPLGRSFSMQRRTLPQPTQFKGIAAFGLVFQIAMIYLINAVTKNGFTWDNGIAMTYALQEEFWRKPLALWLLDYPKLCELLTYSTLVLEYLLPLLLFFPYKNGLARKIASVLILGFHWTVFALFDVGLFHITGLAMAAVLIPASLWDSLAKRWQSGWIVPMNSVPFKKRLPIGPMVGLIVIIFLNVLNLYYRSHLSPLHEKLLTIRKMPFLKQAWAMYAPNPTISPGWIRIKGIFPNGEAIDLSNSKPFDGDDQENLPYKVYPFQLLIYHTCIFELEQSQDILWHWATMEAKRWQTDHPDQPLKAISILRYQKDIQPPGIAGPVNAQELLYYPVKRQ